MFTLAVQNRTKNPVILPCDTAFALLLGRICHFVSSMIAWPNAPPRSDCRCWLSLEGVLPVILIDFLLGSRTSPAPSLRFLPVRINIMFQTRATMLWKLTSLLRRWLFGFVQQNPLNLFLSTFHIQLRTQLPSPFPMQIEPPSDCPSAYLLISQPPTQAIHDELMEPLPATWEYGLRLQTGTNRPIIELVTLTLFL